MNRINNNIQDFFTKWGRAQRQFPSSHEVLKSEILEKLSRESCKVTRVHSRMPWFSVAFAGLAVLMFFITPGQVGRITRVINPAAPMPFAEDAKSGQVSKESAGFPIAPPYYPYEPNIPIADTREFLKTDYQATVYTRNVGELAQRIQTIIRDFGGRVDSASSSSRWGSVSFVVPADWFDEFRDDIKSLVRARFFIEEISTENLLSQEKSIEQQQEQTQETLTELKTDRGQLILTHRSSATSIQSRLDAIRSELAVLQAEVTNNETRLAQIAVRKQELFIEKNAFETRLAAENAEYAKKLNLFDLQIRGVEKNLVYLDDQEEELLDTVATVRGTISLNWISVWSIVHLYFPLCWLSLILIVVAVAVYVVRRRRFRFLI
jgi:hypothetical protein